ncbi:MAG: hypothetical protein ABIQ86_16140 [Steroidobacteraceae bacterium]
MTSEPIMWATYCDDVRQEVGNKLSYLGVYGPNLIVQSFPTTLVKLCCVFSVRVPTSAAPRHVIFKLLRDDDVLFEADLSTSDMKDPAIGTLADGTDRRILTISSIAQLVGFSITQPCVLKARAIVDGKELRGGALELLAADVKH